MAKGTVLKTIGKGVGPAMAFGFPVVNFFARRAEGEGFASALTKGIAEEVLFSMAPLPAMAAYMGKAVFDGAYSHGMKQGQAQSASYRSNFGGQYFDSDKAYTMRQAGANAIQKSGMNARSVLGSEARRFNR